MSAGSPSPEHRDARSPWVGGWRVLVSRKLSVYLLIALAAIMTVGSLLPDLSFLSSAEIAALRRDSPVLYLLGSYFGLRAFTGSWPFLCLVAFLMLSVLACTLRRLARALGKPTTSKLTRAKVSPEFRVARTLLVRMGMREAAVAVRGALTRRGWRVRETVQRGGGKESRSGRGRVGPVGLVGTKGAVGFWGSILFHAGFLILAVGIMLSALTRFAGEIVIAEGQTVRLDRAGLAGVIREPYLAPRLTGFPVTLKDFSAYYEENRFPVDYRAELAMGGGAGGGGAGEEDVTVRVNRPADHGGLRFIMTRYGFAPLFRVREGDTRRLLMDRYVNLVVFSTNSADSFRVEGTDWSVKARFFPDLRRRGVRLWSAGVVPRNPVFMLELLRDRKAVARTLAPLGSPARLGPLEVVFDDLRYWAAFQVVSDKGIGVVFLGLFAGLLGLGVRLLDPDRRIYVRLVPEGRRTKVELGGKYVQTPSFLTDQLGRLEDALKADVVQSNTARPDAVESEPERRRPNTAKRGELS